METNNTSNSNITTVLVSMNIVMTEVKAQIIVLSMCFVRSGIVVINLNVDSVTRTTVTISRQENNNPIHAVQRRKSDHMWRYSVVVLIPRFSLVRQFNNSINIIGCYRRISNVYAFSRLIWYQSPLCKSNYGFEITP